MELIPDMETSKEAFGSHARINDTDDRNTPVNRGDFERQKLNGTQNPENTSTDSVTKSCVLLVDDDCIILDGMASLLGKYFNIITAEDRPSAVHKVQAFNASHQAPPYVMSDGTEASDNLSNVKVALIDMGLPPYPHDPAEGLQLIKDLLNINPNMKILVLSGQDKSANIETALNLGAVDYLAKPAKPKAIKERIEQQISVYNQEANRQHSINNLIGQSDSIRDIHQQISHVSQSAFPALILGESGTGKELIAKEVHDQSSRARKTFVPINCAAIPSELIESLLFGHIKGAFTNAHKDSIGFFGEANEGSIFLDELGELPLPLQAKLLRVLENGEYYRIGETTPRKTGARIIAATNQHLKEEIEKGQFRADLFHRLSILTINVPPLRERISDIPYLIDHFIDSYKNSFDPFRLSEQALNLLKEYPFPGNVRELRNIVIRLGTKYPGATIGKVQVEQEIYIDDSGLQQAKPKEAALDNPREVSSKDLKHVNTHNEPALAVHTDNHETNSELNSTHKLEAIDSTTITQLLNTGSLKLDQLLADIERQCIQMALSRNNNNLSKAARDLHINRSTLHSRIQKYENKE